MKMAAIYARVSSEQQREEHTIASQTAALIEYARIHDLEVPKEWVFEDEGYSGATLERPGLERVRDLAAEGHIQAVLAYAPDRLSRKYAYQILLMEELARNGVETLFVKAPQSATAEDQLLVQFQGMIAEYERAQILERSRRGKRHRARAGEISVLSGAPYGYRYIRKSEDMPASYAVIDPEAQVVQQVYDFYTITGLSIGAITRWLNAERIPTRKHGARWERSTVWAMLRNSAYRGVAYFGKTRLSPRSRITRPLRLRGGAASRSSASQERPREEWIGIPVPAIVSEECFARAQELLQENKVRSRRRTIAPSVVQGLVSCHKCGYALSRTSTRSSARKIHYYRCIGSDGWRRLGGPLCDNRPVRQDLLDQIVWAEVVRLLEDPILIQQELDRRLAAARSSDPTKKREQSLQRELTRIGKSVERLINAYQEELVSLEQLRERMPLLRQRERALRAELQSMADHANDRAAILRLAETLGAFLARLRSAADTLDVTERQRIVRLVVKEVLVGDDQILIRHCIPVTSTPSRDNDSPAASWPPCRPDGQSYLLRTGSGAAPLWRPLLDSQVLSLLQHARVQPFLNETHDPPVRDAVLDELHQPAVVDGVEKRTDVQVEHPVHLSRQDSNIERVQRIVLAAPRTESIREAEEVGLVDGVQHLDRRALDDLVLQRRHAERPLPPVGLRDVRSADWLRSVRSALQPFGEILEIVFQRLAVVPPRLAIHARSGVSLQREIRRAQSVPVVNVVQERGEPHPSIPSCYSSYPLQRTRRAGPALCPGRVLLARVPFGQPPSLRRLLDRSPGFVRRFPRYCEAVRLPRVVHHQRSPLGFPMRPVAPSATGNSGISRFPRMVFPSVLGVSDRAGFARVSRWRRNRCGLPLLLTASAPRRKTLSRLNTRPARTPVDASALPLPATPHDSGPAWVAIPSPYDSFIHNTMPVLTGAQGKRHESHHPQEPTR
jgi:site-specific DNA recombinase